MSNSLSNNEDDVYENIFLLFDLLKCLIIKYKLLIIIVIKVQRRTKLLTKNVNK